MVINLLSWNVNGIRAASRNGFIEWFNKSKPDILCLQETKAHREQLDKNLAEPNGYNAEWHSAEKKGYSGTVTYSRLKPLAVTKGLPRADLDREGRVLETEYSDFVLLNIYFPNSQRDHARLGYKIEFCDAVLARCETLKKQGKGVVICGDYNIAHREIDLKNPKANKDTAGFLPEERAWMDKFLDHGYIDTFRHFNKEPNKYTWWTYRLAARERNIGWRIDYFCVSEDMLPRVKAAPIHAGVFGSDHCPVGLQLESKAS